MAQIHRGVGHSGVLEVIGTALDQKDLHVGVGLSESASCYTRRRSAPSEDDVDFADGLIVGAHVGNGSFASTNSSRIAKRNAKV